MGCILLAILAIVPIFALNFFDKLILSEVLQSKKTYFILGVFIIITYVICGFCSFLGFIFGIFVPISGYEEPQIVSSTELVNLRDETISEGSKGVFYISIPENNSYTYYVEIDSPYTSDSQKAYKSNTISSNNVTIIEDNSYTNAKLDTYVTYGKKSFWTFAIGVKKYEYVFYVPTGTIVQNVSLG